MHYGAFQAVRLSIPAEQIPGINLAFHIVQTRIITVRDNGAASFLEFIKIIHDPVAEKGASIICIVCPKQPLITTLAGEPVTPEAGFPVLLLLSRGELEVSVKWIGVLAGL